MPKQEESDDKVIRKINDLCSQLNIDHVAAKRAMDSFLEIRKNFTLDGDQQHWIACALYVACRTSITPTVKGGKALEGNCVSLTRLLRLCNISLIQFFNKIKNWMEMASMSNEFRERISRLERKFAVSTVLFRKFQPIFQEIFSGLTNEPLKSHTKSKKHKLQPCTTNGLFEFTWCLYICVKGEFYNSADDLVDMYHVLLSCLDFVYANAFMARRIDLINPQFKGLPSDWLNDDFQLPNKPPCIISTLCEIKDGLALEAATMKEYSWKPVIKKFYEKEILTGNAEQMTGLLDVGNFDVNLKSLNNTYETYVLSVGEFDERIFLGEHANEELGTRNVSGEEISQVIATFGPSSRVCPDTPLTGRAYLSRCAEPLTPVSEASNSRARLANYLRNAKPMPSAYFMKLFEECGISESTVRDKLVTPCAEWRELLAASLRDIYNEETINIRTSLVACLYYKVLEHIIREEHRKKPQVPLQMILFQESFHLPVFACCTELLAHAYGMQALRFPRVLAVYSLPAFHFYKVIELVVQVVFDKLTRDVIKHLNAVEEEVLDSIVWRSDSPLWELLARGPVPTSADVKLNESPRPHHPGMMSPVSGAGAGVSAVGGADQARKQLFKDAVAPGQSLLPPASTAPATSAPHVTPSPATTPKKNNNSLNLFFRKFYNLASIRLKDLCMRLHLDDRQLLDKIWTCLERSVVVNTSLLRDRHLDQILMCAVYVICKVSNKPSAPVEKTFAEIMRCYRQRPLADNHVYRFVLIKPATADGPEERGDLINFYNKVYVACMQTEALRQYRDECQLSPLPVSGGGRAFSPCGQRVSDRHQLYVKPLAAPPAPAPHAPAAPHAPHDHSDQMQLLYRFSRSPAKDLHLINTMVSCEVGGVDGLKRAGLAALGAGAGGEGGEVVKRARVAAPGVARKLQGLMTDRQAV